MVLAALSCIKLRDEDSLPQQFTLPSKIVSVPADGRCLWSACFLGAAATQAQLLGWFSRPRTACGVAFHKEDQSREKDLVVDWALRLTDMPPKSHQRLMKGESATHEDLEAWIVSSHDDGCYLFKTNVVCSMLKRNTTR